MTGPETWNAFARALDSWKAEVATLGTVEAQRRMREIGNAIKVQIEGLYHTVCDLSREDYNRAIGIVQGKLQALGAQSFPQWWGTLDASAYAARRASLGCIDAGLTTTPGLPAASQNGSGGAAPADVVISSDIVIAALVIGGIAGLAGLALLVRKIK